jgi:hypothetical protein
MSALSELFIAIGIKAEGLDQLVAIHERLQQIAGEARNAIKALAELNGITIAPSVATPANPQGTAPAGPAAPAVAPVAPMAPTAAPAVAQPATPNPTGYTNPIGPQIPPSVFINQAKAKLTAIKQLSEGLNKLAVILGAVAAATAVLIAKSVTATMEMANFGKATDMSTAKLQAFQHAAQVGGASGAEMAGLLDSLQTKIQEVRIGEGDVSPFAMLGLDVSKNPMQMMDDLRAKLATMGDEQKQFARMLAGRIGINSAMFASLLRQSKELSKSLVLEQGAIDSTQDLNAAWQDLLFSLSAVRNQITSALAPTFTFLAARLSWVVSKLAVFTHWLASSSPVAKALSVILGVIVAALFAVAAALAIAAAGITAAAAVMTVMSFVSSGLAAALWGVVTAAAAVAAPFLLIGVLIGAVVLAWDEAITAFQGGETVFGKLGDDLVAPFTAIYDFFSGLSTMIDNVWGGIVGTISGAIANITALIPDWLFKWLGGTGIVAVNPLASITQAAAQPPSNQPNAGKSSNVSQDIEINVDGSKDPKETAKAVNNGLKTALSNASYQMPAYSV